MCTHHYTHNRTHLNTDRSSIKDHNMGLPGVDKKSLQELQSMSNPPQIVKQVITASCMLLGHPVHIAKDFTLQRKVLKTLTQGDVSVPDTIDPEALALAKEEVKHIESAAHVKKVSAAASCLYVWTEKRLQEMESK